MSLLQSRLRRKILQRKLFLRKPHPPHRRRRLPLQRLAQRRYAAVSFLDDVINVDVGLDWCSLPLVRQNRRRLLVHQSQRKRPLLKLKLPRKRKPPPSSARFVSHLCSHVGAPIPIVFRPPPRLHKRSPDGVMNPSVQPIRILCSLHMPSPPIFKL